MGKPEFKPPTIHDELKKVEARLALVEDELKDPKDPAEKQRLKLQEREKGDIREALKNPAVRRFFYRVLNLSGILASSGDPNPTIIAHHEGRRSIGLEIYRAIKEADPAAYYQMERDAESDKKSQQKETTDAS